MRIEPHERGRFWAVNLLAWLGVAVMFTFYYRFNHAMLGTKLPNPAWYMLMLMCGRSAIWAMFTPVIFMLGDRFPLKGRWRMPHLFLHLALSFIAMLATFYIMMAARFYRSHMSFDFFVLGAFSGIGAQTFTIMLHYWAVLFVGLLRDYIKDREAAARRESILRAQLAESQLRALQGQMKPHFIHNALNAVAALVKAGKSDAAVDTIANISGLLRSLSDAPGRNLVPLREEEEFVHRMLAVERMRFGEKLGTHIDIADDCRDILVPTLVLQPLVENAIKHGIARRTRPGRVIVRARREAGRLRLEVVNDGPPPASPVGPRPAPGVGLAATLQRLERIYDKDYTAHFEFQREEDVSAVLTLPASPALP